MRILLSLVAVVLSVAGEAGAAPSGLPTKAIDLDFKAASVTDILSLLGGLSSVKVAADTCLKDKTVDLHLKNTPVAMVLDVLASKLGLDYRLAGGTLYVRCRDASGEEEARGDRRVSLRAHDRALRAAIDDLSRSAGLAPADYAAEADPQVDVLLVKVRLRTALAVLSETSGVPLRLEGNRIVAGR